MPGSTERQTYGSGFFEQLSGIFGRFRDTDLQRAFQEARPIDCSELVGRRGEWRTVAFFNEDRGLGEWYRESLDDVRSDLAVYTFAGQCAADRGKILVTTEFPTAASVESYNRGEIRLNQVDVLVNEPAHAMLNPKTLAYTFELPYLFLTSRRGAQKLYSLTAPDRNASYATDVTSRWECKSVSSKDLTYRFLICRTSTLPRANSRRSGTWESAFGAGAFFILSDGMEATSSVHVSFGSETDASEEPAEEPPGSSRPARPILKRRN